MRRHPAMLTTLTILVLGSSSLAIAKVPDAAGKELLAEEEYEKSGKTKDSYTSYERKSIDIDEENFETMCEKNGGPTAYRDFWNVQPNLIACLRSKTSSDVAVDKLLTEFHSNGTKPAWNGFVTTMCRHLDRVHECTSDAVASTKACFDSQARKTITKMDHVNAAIIDFVCEDNGARFLSFIEGYGTTCIAANMRGINICLQKALPPETKYATRKTSFERFVELLSFDKDDCSHLDDAQRCIVKELKHCEDGKHAIFVDDLIDAARSPTVCQSGASVASSISSTLILIATMIVTYLPFA